MNQVLESKRKVYELAGMKEQLRKIIQHDAVRHGTFLLASGRTSSYYIDMKKVLFNPEALFIIGELLYDLTRHYSAVAFGGPEIGAIPMAAAAGRAFFERERTVKTFTVRKQAKDHGAQNRIEGSIPTGDDAVVLLEDVMTTGGSVADTLEVVEKYAIKASWVICLVDRLEGAAERFKRDRRYHAFFTIEDLGIKPEPAAKKEPELWLPVPGDKGNYVFADTSCVFRTGSAGEWWSALTVDDAVSLYGNLRYFASAKEALVALVKEGGGPASNQRPGLWLPVPNDNDFRYSDGSKVYESICRPGKWRVSFANGTPAACESGDAAFFDSLKEAVEVLANADEGPTAKL